jgi:hypothetical protein
LSSTSQAEGGERPLPGTDDGSGGGTIVPLGTFVPPSEELIVVSPSGGVLDEDDDPVPPEPDVSAPVIPDGSCGPTV